MTNVYKMSTFRRYPDRQNMNPATLLRLWSAFDSIGIGRPLHILQICGESGCWPQTVYQASFMGYLEKHSKAHFQATSALLEEVRKAENNRRIA